MYCITNVLSRKAKRAIAVLTVGIMSLSCEPMKVADPTAILDADLSNAEGARMAHRNMLVRLHENVISTTFESALLSDEFFYQLSALGEATGSIAAEEYRDRRESEQS